MQLDQHRQQQQLVGQQRQLSMQAAEQVGQQRQLTGQQQQLHQAVARQAPQSWASAAAQPPSLAALAGRPVGSSIAANLASVLPAHNSSSNGSDEWQTAVASHGRQGRRHGAAGGSLSGSGGNGGSSSVSSGSSPHPPSL